MRTLGTVVYSEKRRKWLITCEPHVVIRLKRVFPKIDASAKEAIALSASPENSRDLAWFLERYPMEVREPETLQALVSEHVEGETLLECFRRGESTHVPHELKIPPRDYQVAAAELWHHRKGLLIGDSVGVGKTATSLTGLSMQGKLPALVVTLTNLCVQWEQEVQRFTGFRTHILRGVTPYDISKYCDGLFPDLIITNYHKLDGWARTLEGTVKAVVFDEVHELRHNTSARYRAATRLAHAAEWRCGLTATPLFGYGSEIFNIMETLRPGDLGTFDEFHREWCSSFGTNKYKLKNPAAFGSYIREAGYYIRRTRKDVQREMPRATIVPHTIEADTTALDRVKGHAVGLARLVLAKEEEYKGQKMRAAGELDAFIRRATGVAKAPYVAEFVRFLHQQSGEKILLYGWHHDVYDIWIKELQELKPVLYTGKQSTTQKEEAKRRFVEGEAQVMIMSLRAGAGVDGLQKACHITVTGELDYSPSVHIQNGGRVDRDGQDEPVIHYFLLADSGSDPIISDILGVKRQQLEGVNNPDSNDDEFQQVEAEHIKRLARDYLTREGLDLPEEGTQ